MKRGLMGVLLLMIVLTGLFLAWASYPWEVSPRTFAGKIYQNPAATQSDQLPTTLTILSWNIGYAYGLGSEGTADYRPRDAAFFKNSLSHMAETIRLSEADIVLLQEVDFAASRSAQVDQLQELARLTGMPYYAEAISWQAQYVPFPYWPLGRQFGKMRSGGGILSRWPITSNQVHLLAKPASKPWWYNLFYLYRYLQVATVKIHDQEISLVNLHLEAFDQSQREIQSQDLVGLSQKQKLDFIAGDFNTLPDGAIKRSGFANPDDHYEGDRSYQILKGMPLQEIVGEASYLSKEEAWFTFPSNKPDRRLDYIYYAPRWSVIRAEVVQSPHSWVSDHLPVKAVFNFFAPQFIQD